MKVDSTHSVLGWFYGNHLVTETRKTYHYDQGNDVTVIERRSIQVASLYDGNGKTHEAKDKGQHIDLKG